MPMAIPVKEMAEKLSNNIQSISILPISPINPMKDFRAMIVSDVVIALFMGSLKKRISTGTIKKPPPVPVIPVMIPIPVPNKKMGR